MFETKLLLEKTCIAATTDQIFVITSSVLFQTCKYFISVPSDSQFHLCLEKKVKATVRAMWPWHKAEPWSPANPQRSETAAFLMVRITYFLPLELWSGFVINTTAVRGLQLLYRLHISHILTTQTKTEHLVWWTILEGNRAFSFTVSLLLHVLYTCFCSPSSLYLSVFLSFFFPSFFPLSGADVAAVAQVRGHWGFGFPEPSLLQSSVRALPSAQPTHCSLLWKNISLQAAQGGKEEWRKISFFFASYDGTIMVSS